MCGGTAMQNVPHQSSNKVCLSMAANFTLDFTAKTAQEPAHCRKQNSIYRYKVERFESAGRQQITCAMYHSTKHRMSRYHLRKIWAPLCQPPICLENLDLDRSLDTNTSIGISYDAHPCVYAPFYKNMPLVSEVPRRPASRLDSTTRE